MSQYFDDKNVFLEPKVTQYGSHMVMTDVSKPTKFKYFTIDTRFRDQYDTSSVANYNISLPERIKGVKSMFAKSVEIPLSYYNISSHLGNNSFQLINVSASTPTTTVSKTVVINSKQYNTVVESTAPWASGSLLDTINIELGASGWHSYSNIVFTYDNATKKITLANNASVNIKIVFDQADCVNGAGGFSPNESLMSKLGWLMGFRLSSYEIPSGGSIIGEANVDLNGPKYLYLIIDEFKNGNPHSFLGVSRTSQLSSQQILARIVPNYTDNNFNIVSAFHPIMLCEPGSYMVSDKRIYGESVDLQRMNIRIVDEFGRIMNFNGIDFSVCLELEHV